MDLYMDEENDEIVTNVFSVSEDNNYYGSDKQLCRLIPKQ